MRLYGFGLLVALLAGGSKPLLPQTTANARAESAPKAAISPAPKAAISPQEIERLRPVVLPDLRKAVALVDNDKKPSANEIEKEFGRCEFTALDLGALGAAVLVKWNGLGGVDVPMLNIYALRNGYYRRVVEGGGFGPEIVHGSGPAPDLVFGATAGVCHATYFRYRYREGRYDIDACDQEIEGKNGDCAIVACGNKLPTFPNPFANE